MSAPQKKLYVRYCGGCNPTYDRVKLAKDTACLLDAQLVTDAPQQADFCLLLCGCSRACIRLPEGVNGVVCSHGQDAEALAAQLQKEPIQ